MDVAITQDGSSFYILESGTPARLMQCIVATSACSTYNIPGLLAKTPDSAAGNWTTISADGSTLAMNTIGGSAAARAYEGYVITGLSNDGTGTNPVVTDAGALAGPSAGRFIDNVLNVAEQNQLATYSTATDFGTATPSSTSALPMIGEPIIVLRNDASFWATFLPITPFATYSYPLIWTGTRFVTTTSATVYLNTSYALYPAVSAIPGGPWDYYGYWDPASTYLLYSFDHVHWLSYPWDSKNFMVSRTVWVRSTHASEINARGSVSPVTVYTAKPYLVSHYLVSSRHLYGTVNVGTGTRLVVQRRLSNAKPWATYYSGVPVSAYQWGVTLPHEVAQWRVVVPATPSYVAAISVTIFTT